MLYNILIPVAIFIGLGLVAGIALSIFSKIFAVETDERTEKILEALPGLNCGVCGFSGCENYANNLVNNDAPTNRCVPGGDKASKKISAILGKDYVDVIEMEATVRCGGQVPDATEDNFIYDGEKTCVACNMFYQGKGKCDYGCIGFGDCVKKCPEGAISIVDEIAVVNTDLCVGCTLCVATCPKHLIQMKRHDKKVFVRCSSCNNGKATINNCAHGCIGCKKCEKTCPSGAITVTNNLASIDYEKCTNCMECVNVCPMKCINVISQ
ncbi:RnfABCDGE type electron transport complex subunit B [Paludicola sp. MB14-C6]|uniref:RnfABCDGE type electron transport complex subunit B n=1 Tax=Paludihabitans sp. MB14-C6 TaxID=3070656 RepID=UPI0027DE4C4A|nr:RnfABCDGE type electron transport complex subunit B [Paludicola sp. MB14-C6]WMJ23310.1 RnfABCDGE type electron transport complex subunit B [Paludicola sp. MB14-C6]